MNTKIIEFTVVLNIAQGKGQSFHEWFIEFENLPENVVMFAERIDNNLCGQKMYIMMIWLAAIFYKNRK